MQTLAASKPLLAVDVSQISALSLRCRVCVSVSVYVCGCSSRSVRFVCSVLQQILIKAIKRVRTLRRAQPPLQERTSPYLVLAGALINAQRTLALQATPLLGRLHQQQHGSHHNRNANNKRRADDAAAAGPRVYLSHEPCSGWSKDRQDHPPAAANDQVPVYGAWAITPLLAHSACRRVLLAAPMRWLVVVDAASRVNVSGLVAALRREPAHRVSD